MTPALIDEEPPRCRKQPDTEEELLERLRKLRERIAHHSTALDDPTYGCVAWFAYRRSTEESNDS